MKYSKTTRGFYLTSIHGNTIPQDAVDVDDATYAALLLAQSKGQIIVPDANGNPVAAANTPPAPTAAQQIVTLEAQQTPRRMREAMLGTDGGWMKAQDEKIAALRAQMTKSG